jgi:sorbitol/mannitol transport system permease protein
MASTTSATTPSLVAGGTRSQRNVNTMPLVAPSVVLLFLWMIVPLAMTLWFSFQYYNLLDPLTTGFAGFDNYTYLLQDPSLWTAMANTLFLVFWVLVITVGLGTLLAVLFDQEFYGRGIARLLAIAPFFVMPTVSALIWKNMLMHPVNGLFAFFSRTLGLPPIDFFGSYPLTSVIVIVAWQWLPFACLIFITSLQSLDRDQMEAAGMDGANVFQKFWFLTLPHLGRPIAVVVMIEMIFLMSVFAEIFTTTGGGPGNASTNVAFLIFKQALMNFDVGVASAGALFAVVLANIAAVFLIRMIGKNLD